MILLFQEPLVLFFGLADCVQHPTGERLGDLAFQGMIVPERLLLFCQRYFKQRPHRVRDLLLVTELYPVPHGVGLGRPIVLEEMDISQDRVEFWIVFPLNPLDEVVKMLLFFSGELPGCKSSGWSGRGICGK